MTLRRGKVLVRVDPRGCGGDRMVTYRSLDELGRSPRVRGRRICARRSSWMVRSIPAGAGET